MWTSSGMNVGQPASLRKGKPSDQTRQTQSHGVAQYSSCWRVVWGLLVHVGWIASSPQSMSHRPLPKAAAAGPRCLARFSNQLRRVPDERKSGTGASMFVAYRSQHKPRAGGRRNGSTDAELIAKHVFVLHFDTILEDFRVTSAARKAVQRWWREMLYMIKITTLLIFHLCHMGKCMSCRSSNILIHQQ